MISVMALIRTATELNAEIVAAPHRALAEGPEPGAEILGMVFNRITDLSDEAAQRPDGLHPDAISQFFCPSISAGMSAAAAGALDLSLGVPGHLVREVHPVLCLQSVVRPVPDPQAGCVKRMSLLRRRAGMTAEAFQAEWLDLHATLMGRLPGLRGCRQNLVLDGPSDPQGQPMLDGMVELWFDGEAAIDAALASGAGRTAIAHGREFIAETASFLVEPTRLHGLS